MKNEIAMAENLRELLASKNYSTAKAILAEMQPEDIVELLEDMEEDELLGLEELPILFRILPKSLAADAFVEMDADTQRVLIQSFSDGELKAVLDDIYLDDTVDIIEEMPANVVKRILESVDADTRKNINLVLNYPDDSAGSLMTTEYIDLKRHFTVEHAFEHIRKTGAHKETVYTCYVTDRDRHLLGLVSVRDMLLSPQTAVIEDIMETKIVSVTTLEDDEDVAQLFYKYDFTALPVVDGENRLVGIITVDDAIEVIQDEATEDIEKMAAITPSDKTYFKTGVWATFKARIPWLLLLMVSATFTGMIITSFESALAAQVALTAFIPMLMDTGGNSGSQASVTIIRGMSLGEIDFGDIARVLWKESRVGIMCGITLAVANFARLMIFENVGMTISLVVGITLVATVTLAKIFGCALPMLAKKIGFDPAVMASPFITTVVDAMSLSLYFGIATWLLKL